MDDNRNETSPRPGRAVFDLVTLDAANSSTLAAFWVAALGLVVTETEDDDRWIVLGTQERPRVLGVQRISGLAVTPSPIDGSGKAKVHLDLACSRERFDSEVERLLTLGATRARDDRREPYGLIATLRDPEGNLFDLCAYES